MKHANIRKSKSGTIAVDIWVDDKYIAVLYGNHYEVRWDDLFEEYQIKVMTDPMSTSGIIHVDNYICLTHNPY